MTSPGSTCWTLIRGAASGHLEDRAEFARRYEALICACFGARWRTRADAQETSDAAQAVFVECFKAGGVLDRASSDPPRDFRAFLLGVVRNVALRFERTWARRRDTPAGSTIDLDRIEQSEATLSRVFDRAWAEAIVGEAATMHERSAVALGAAGARRVELLRLRFRDGLPIRDIAARWNLEPRYVHGQYETARKEFERCLLKVVEFHNPDAPHAAMAELDQVLEILGAARREAAE